jgi:hypothetical protein
MCRTRNDSGLAGRQARRDSLYSASPLPISQLHEACLILAVMVIQGECISVIDLGPTVCHGMRDVGRGIRDRDKDVTLLLSGGRHGHGYRAPHTPGYLCQARTDCGPLLGDEKKQTLGKNTPA